jgi:hypothetical protein
VFSGTNNANVTFRNMDAPTAAMYERAVTDIQAQGATIVRDDLLGSTWVEKYRAQPPAPNPFAYDQTQYLKNLGPGAAFTAIEGYFEAIDRQGKPADYKTRLQRFTGTAGLSSTEVDPRTSAAGTTWLQWRNELLTLFVSAMDEKNLDGLAFPINGKRPPTLPEIQSVDNPGAIDPNAANNDPLIQGTVNLLGLPA